MSNILKIKDEINDEEFINITRIVEREIYIDLKEKDFLTTKEIKMLNMLTNIGKIVNLLNANNKIEKLLKYLNYQGIYFINN